MNLIDIGHAGRVRRAELGLSQAQLAHLSGLSRQTLVGLENGTLGDLGVNRVGQVMALLGLDTPKSDTLARSKKRGLWMVAKTASVSYAHELAPEALEQALASGDVPLPIRFASDPFARRSARAHRRVGRGGGGVARAFATATGLAQRGEAGRILVRAPAGAVGMKSGLLPGGRRRASHNDKGQQMHVC